MRRFEAPYPLNFLHVLQTEGMLFKGLLAPGAAREAAVAGWRLWRFYGSEGVFPDAEADWDSGFRTALRLNRATTTEVSSPLQYLHAGLASAVGATHYLSFEPGARQAASAAGPRVLPERL